MNSPAEIQEQEPVGLKPAMSFDLTPKSLDEALRFSEILSNSDIVPKDYQKKPGNILVAIQWGLELGLKPMQAMQNIAVINGRPSVWGDAIMALVRSSPVCEYVYETDDGHTATCRVKRRGQNEEIRTFSIDDAVSAGLDKKAGPWTQYPKRMRQMRARAFALRDVFADLLKGIPIAEEVMDLVEKDITPRKTQEAARPQLENYPNEAFEKNFSKWKSAIEEGKSDHQTWINTLSKKGQLTAEQLERINSVESPAISEETE